MKRLLVAVITLSAACGAHQKDWQRQNVQYGEGDDSVTCRNETPVGSNIERRICRKKLDQDEQRKAAQEMGTVGSRVGGTGIVQIGPGR